MHERKHAGREPVHQGREDSVEKSEPQTDKQGKLDVPFIPHDTEIVLLRQENEENARTVQRRNRQKIENRETEIE